MNLTNDSLGLKNMTWQFGLILILLLILNNPHAEEVCKAFYKEYPEDLNGKEMIVPEKTVALSERILVGTPTVVKEGQVQGSASIFFVIDHSSSMYSSSKDKNGHRFTVPFTLLDTIQKRMPNAEVGIAVFGSKLFFIEDDSPYFVKAPQWENAYLPLMTLNSTYDNYETGYDIVKRYLDSEEELYDGSIRLKYRPSSSVGRRTNINCAFDAAKHAMSSSKYPKNKQFIIFFSDGAANEPNPQTSNRYVAGDNVPATFTVFFSTYGYVPASIQAMTENIKNNGYSDNNHISKCWGYENTTKDSLKNFLIDNVFQKIFTKTVAEPQKITINGTLSADDWDGKTFVFPDMFPLTGITTKFTEEINYTAKTDSIIKNKSTGKEETDTSVSVGFAVKIEENARIEENILIECWNRELQFFHDDKPVDMANETMDELEIRFKEDKVDILYGYENVTLHISNSSTKKTDLETFKLDDKGSYFSYTFKRELNSSPVRSDKKLGHSLKDSIIATFRNPALPLDTIRYGIPFHISGTVELDKGYYYDNNADGYIDSIFIAYKGDILKEQARELVDFVTLPSHRGFETIDANVYDDGIGLTVRQKDVEYDDRMVTRVTEEDFLFVKYGVLQSGGLVTTDTVEIIDKVAPVIMKAHLINYEDPEIDDILEVTFSEPILKVTKHEPFYFWSSNPRDLLYIGDLRILKSDETTMSFELRSIKGVTDPVSIIHKNDSIWIYWEDKQVGDKLLNYQDNKNNRRRNLDIDQRYSYFALVPEGVSPYNREDLKKHEIPSQILDILKKDNIADIKNSVPPNSGMLLRVTPQVPKKRYKKEIVDFYLEGYVTIFDAVGNTVIKNKEMGYHENTKTLNFVWNGRNYYKRACGAGPYLALFKVTPFRGPKLHKLGELSLTLPILIK